MPTTAIRRTSACTRSGRPSAARSWPACRPPPRVDSAPKYFYDALGCALFGAICELPEYYPTRTERAIFSEHRDAIADAVGQGKQFVDLGAGDCCKALAWLPFLAPARYVAVDIAGDEIAKSLATMAPDFPEVEMLGIVADFTHGLDLAARPRRASRSRSSIPGSSIGNFTPVEARGVPARRSTALRRAATAAAC